MYNVYVHVQQCAHLAFLSPAALEGLDSEEAESEAELEEAIEGVSSASCEAECHEGFYTSEHGNTHICYGMAWHSWVWVCVHCTS